MVFNVAEVLRITDPTPEVIRYCQDHLTMPNPEYAKKMQMGFWTGNTPETLYLYERHGDELVLPFGTLRGIWPLIREYPHSTSFPVVNQIRMGGNPVPLYDYQQEAVGVMYHNSYGILQSPAGSGKTQMAIALVKMYSRPTLWLTHTTDLLNQSMERASRYIDPELLGTITAGRVNIGKAVTFATVQTMANLDPYAYRDWWDVIIVDECHHVAGSPTKMMQFYKVLNHLNARHKYGLSATVHRSDGMIAATHAILGQIVYTVPDSAVEKYVMPVTVQQVDTWVGESEEYLSPDGMISYTKLINYLTANEDRNKIILETLVLDNEHPSLILSHRLDHLVTMMNSMPPAMRKRAVMVSGTMQSKSGKAEREKALNEIRVGKKWYMFATYSLAKEGLDIPCLERLYLTTPVKDEAVVIQAIGRIARTNPKKDAPKAYDFVDKIRYCQKAWKQRVRHYKKIGCEFE